MQGIGQRQGDRNRLAVLEQGLLPTVASRDSERTRGLDRGFRAARCDRDDPAISDR